MVECDVVIVGAGAAGLACARRLGDAAVDYLLLEASHRAGGRMLTDSTVGQGWPLELGALMIHGRRSITHGLARAAGLHVRRLPLMARARMVVGGRPRSIARMLLPGRGMGPGVLLRGLLTLPRDLEAFRGPDLSLGAFLDGRGEGEWPRRMAELLNAHAAAADPDAIGVRGPAEEAGLAAETFGYTNFQILEGYTPLVDALVGPVKGRLRLGSRVTSIERSEDGVVVGVKGPTGPGEIAARRAVVTLPLGVLRSRGVTFKPPLPREKLEAMAAIGFGDALTVHMRLRGGDLVRRFGDFALLWGGGASTFHRPYVGLRDRPPTLAAFTVGREARRRSSLDDAQLLDSTLAEFREILPPGTDVGEVEAWTTHRWPTDPLVQGGYSNLPPGASVVHRRTLAQPVDGVLFFAGEATHFGGEAATVHGAMETGRRAADEVLGSLGRP